jgi:hypothetical protein
VGCAVRVSATERERFKGGEEARGEGRGWCGGGWGGGYGPPL